MISLHITYETFSKLKRFINTTSDMQGSTPRQFLCYDTDEI